MSYSETPAAVQGYHIPVLLAQCLDLLSIKPDGVYLDATLGGGGHARAILDRLGPGGRLIGVDRDADALECAKGWRDPYGDKFEAIRASFAGLRQALGDPQEPFLDGVLFDLGVSSHQLDVAGRGFSFRAGGPLDMRMDARDAMTAEDIVRTWDADEIKDALRKYGEERYAGRIASAIVRERDRIKTTADLAAVVKRAVPGQGASERIHPATRTFQAFRILINDEMEALEQGLEQAVSLLRPGGRIVVISYHSLEDRIVKNAFREWSKGCICPPRMPLCRCGHTATVKILTRKPVVPTDEEIRENPRARSAKARGAERLPV
ncbi:MAG TPA: 16S rRNA (cytosine(1402)-N(4))-methyltransferase RsmH [Armatimonadota bacterium]